jgi:hypothetical protein
LQVQAADVKFNATSGSFAHYIETASTSGGNTASMRLKANTYNYGLYVADNANSLVFYDYGQSLERMRIDSSGNLGVGTSSPRSKLQVTATNSDTITPGTAVNGPIFSSGNTLYGLQFSIGDSGNAYAQVQRFDSNTAVYDLCLQPAGGNVGIGTSSAGQRLTVATSTNFQMRIGDSNAVGVYDIGRNSTSGLLTFYGNQTTYTGYVFSGVDGERMRIDQSGNVGIGTSSPGYKLSVNGTITVGDSTGNSGPGSGPGSIEGGAVGYAAMQGSRGYMSVNMNSYISLYQSVFFNPGTSTNTPSGIGGNGYWFGMGAGDTGNRGFDLVGTSSGQLFFRARENGTWYVCTVSTASDYRLKENVTAMTGALSAVDKLKPVNYTLIKEQTNHSGFIAHELQEVIPDAVIGVKDAMNEDGTIKPQSINEAKIVPLLVKAIQELNAEVQALKQQLGK